VIELSIARGDDAATSQFLVSAVASIFPDQAKQFVVHTAAAPHRTSSDFDPNTPPKLLQLAKRTERSQGAAPGAGSELSSSCWARVVPSKGFTRKL
jgi:hypothetical protein